MAAPIAEITIRDARPDDADTVADIWYSGWRDGHLGHVSDELVAARTAESFRSRSADRVADTRVAVVDGGVVGFVMVAGDEIEQVYLSAQHRGIGVADRLMDDAESRIAASGHSAAWLAVVAGNRRARSFYERHGWSDEGLFDYTAADGDGSINVPCHRYQKRLI